MESLWVLAAVVVSNGCLAADAALSVLTGKHSGVVVDSATFRYFGSQSERLVVAEAVHLDGERLCGEIDRDTVRGKIVVSKFDLATCGKVSAYKNLDKAGAVAFVKDSV